MKVSVVVPVHDPGADIDDCIRSLTAQSLPPEEYEVIFVDDGSTDATPARLDALAAEHPNVRVEHIPNSGWPGRPRNIGIDMARGEFVYFVDNDDWLDREALERLHATAVRDGADVVVGKVVGHGKPVPRGLFSRNVSGATVESRMLLGLLTPHKLFRRALLDEHGIRFPEGRRRLEDHVFVMHAYLHARSISVLADHPCYHWVLRGDRSNASYAEIEPAGYYGNVREVLAVIEEHTEPGPLRDELLAHWYRGKMLRRVGGRAFLQREPGHRRAVYDAVRELALERYDAAAVHPRLGFHLRVRSVLLRRGDYEALHALARFETGLRADAVVVAAHRRRGRPALDVDATLGTPRAPLLLREAPGGGMAWAPPEELRGALQDDELLVGEPAAGPCFALLRSAATGAEYSLPLGARVHLEPAGDGAVRVRQRLRVRLDPRTAASGTPLAPGDWELRAVVRVAGFAETVPAHRPGQSAPLTVTVDAGGRIARLGTGRRAPLRERVRERLPPWARRTLRRLSTPGR